MSGEPTKPKPATDASPAQRGKAGSVPEARPSASEDIAAFVATVEAGAMPERCNFGARIGMLDCVGTMIAGDTSFGVRLVSVLLALPMKVICQSDCRGLCANCGANLNHEECRCETHATDPRMAPLARLKQDWLKKQ